MTVSRRRWSFGLRTLFVLVTAFACWLGYQMNWIRERRAVLADPALEILWESDRYAAPTAPGWLWLLGERGVAEIIGRCDHEILTVPDDERIKRLFPEASFDWAECG